MLGSEKKEASRDKIREEEEEKYATKESFSNRIVLLQLFLRFSLLAYKYTNIYIR
jgi:hypothetical protein